MAASSPAKPAIFAYEIKLDQKTTLIKSLQINGVAEGVLIIKRHYLRSLVRCEVCLAAAIGFSQQGQR